MLEKFSLYDLQRAYPDNFRRWALGGTLLAAVGYSFVAASALWQAAPGTIPPYTQGVAAVTCWLAVAVSLRGATRAGIALAIATIWVEVHAGYLTAGIFPSPGMLAAPIIVISAGLLFGARLALLLAGFSIVVTPIIYRLQPGRDAAFTRVEVYWLVVYGVVVLACWGLIALSLTILARTLRVVEEKEHALADMVALAPDGILVVGSDDRVMAANPAAERILALATARCVGRAIGDVLADAGARDASTLQLAEPMAAPLAWTLHRQGYAPVHVEVTWRTLDERRRQLMLRDVSERVRADEARREAEGQLAHAQRLDAVGQLAGGIAHDFNNLLMTVGGSSDLLRDETDPDERSILLDEIAAAQERGTALTRQLLAFARREVVHPVVLDLSAHVATLQRLLQRIAGSGVQVFCDLCPDARIRADVGQVEQALVNLVANARDAMPNGGTCAVTVDRVTDASHGPRVRLRVADSGLGMDARTASRAFEPFFTTKPRGRGTGLGLASVHGIVLQNGGSVSLESAPGAGTTVTLSFPFIDAPVESSNAPQTERLEGGAVGAERAGARILVAEDDDSTRAVVGRILARAGYRVQLLPDGVQAIRRLEAEPHGIDLLITDVVMPGLTGPQLVAKARALAPRLPVVFMSGYPEEAIEAGGTLPLAGDFLSKPFSGSDLLRLVAAKLGEPEPSPAVVTTPPSAA